MLLFPRAHAAKAERLRQAKAEAEKEISAYRAEREGAYQKKLAEVGGTGSRAGQRSLTQQQVLQHGPWLAGQLQQGV